MIHPVPRPAPRQGRVLDRPSRLRQSATRYALAIACLASLACNRPQHANVLLVSLDSVRADRVEAQRLGKPLAPTLARVAAEGATFTRAYSAYPNTLGSHSTLFTGLAPSEHRMAVVRAAGEDFLLKHGVATLAGEFRDAGYATAAFTENAFLSKDFGFDAGFDVFEEGPLGTPFRFPAHARDTVDRALGWLATRPASPFFLFVHSYEAHVPYEPSPENLRAVVGEEAAGSTSPFARRFDGLQSIAFHRGTLPLTPTDLARIADLYDAEVHGLDAELGRLLAFLDSAGLSSSTLVVLLADHGEEFGDQAVLGHGESLHESGLHVPLLLRLPGTIRAGTRVETPVGLGDVGPTIAELAGIGTIFADTHARSLAASLHGKDTDRPVFSELERRSAVCPGAAPDAPLGCDFDAVSVRDARYAYVQSRADGSENLYDRRVDPDETTDLAEARKEETTRYRALVQEYRRTRTPHRAATVRAAQPVTPQVVEKLRALGYLQ